MTLTAIIFITRASERNAYLWVKRKLFFGEDAAVIWAGDLRDQKVADAVGEIDQLEQASFEDKVAYYNFRLEDIYAEEYEGYKKKAPQKMMDRFLTSESVQQDLQAMPEDQRRKSLEEFRRTMGLDEAALERWSALDATRDERWRIGETYIQRRAQIVSEAGGAEQRGKLDALRQELFGLEADTIKDEEAAGFYRFKHKRIYGQN